MSRLLKSVLFPVPGPGHNQHPVRVVLSNLLGVLIASFYTRFVVKTVQVLA